jgi:protein-L-isoaspartate(D-aspartate) O-methyltransferase
MTNTPPRRAKFPLRLERFHGAPAGHAQPAMLRPQGQVAHAHAHNRTGRGQAPVGLGLDSTGVRRRMIDRLRLAGIAHEGVLAVMGSVPRHHFVDAALVTQAYEDTSLPIGHGQTISKPSVVARMIELLLPTRAANLRLVYGDGMLGHAPNAPYDSIIAAAGGDHIPEAWLEQLAIGGRLISPVIDGGGMRQVLVMVDRTEAGYDRTTREVVQFVPLKSGRDR